ncbi:MAG: hypothetical protein C0602_04775 [Denitrovibrio sp.]|nr:MAG: hypothetical protein C0602_04775 [Denitrovibrio sp.]
MPPKKTTRKPAARKPAAKKTTARKPAKRQYRKKKPDRKIPISALFAVIPLILLSAFIILRFSGGTSPEPVKAQPEFVIKEIPQTVIKKIEKNSVPDTVKLFLFEKNIKNTRLDISGSSISIAADSQKTAAELAGDLKQYLIDQKITVDGYKVLTAEDSEKIYNISFKYPEPVTKKTPKAAAKSYRAKLAVVIDDCGYSLPLARELAEVRYPVTFAVIPFTPHGKETASLAKKSGNTFFIHFPMQPKSYPKFDPGKGALFLNMPETIIQAVTKANFEYFPMAPDGANNHTGSAFTESGEKMAQALGAIKKYTPRFMDSYTSGSSVAFDECQKAGMECAVNNVFLDNEEPGLVTVTDKRNHVHSQLIVAAKKALSKGSAIAIGHLKKGTVSALNNSFDEIERMGVQIVPVTELMN